MTTPYHANLGEIRAFVLALFRYAGEGTYISLRAFEQGDSGAAPPRFITPLRVNGDMEKVVRDATVAAETAAQCDTPLVFCPPICTFSNGFRARLVDLANGLALSVEVDDGDPDEARLKLEAILGPPTFIVRSGSSWVDPVTGEIKPKIHLHWRLNEPTTTAEDHDRLRHARSMATLLCGGDPTAKPVVHPLRWPGSWNMKNTARPTMATGIPVDVNVEIDLGDAIEKLEAAVEAAGLLKSGDSPGGSGQSSTPEARLKDVISAMAALPNPGEDVSYQQWVRLGYAVCRATGNAPEAFDIWDRWSQKSAKYDAKQTQATWKRILAGMASAPQKTVGAGTIFYLASAAGWVRPIPFAFRGNGHDQEPGEDAAFDPGGSKEPPRKRILSMIELDALPAPEWMVHGLIPEKSLVIPFGPPKSGKTFIVLSFCLHVAGDKPWFGHAVRSGAVVYIAGEGTGGLSLRLRAMRKRYEIAIDAPFWIIPRAVNFRVEAEVVELVKLIRATVGDMPVAAVVVDTMARAMPGADENSAQDVGLVIAGLDYVKEELSCVVIPVHHTGKEAARGARGTSAIRGALDTGLIIDAKDKKVTMTVSDQKEAEAGQVLTFSMEEVVVGLGRTSLVPILDTEVEPDEVSAGRPVDERNFTGRPGVVLKILRDLMAGADSGILPPLPNGPTQETRGVPFEVWRRACLLAMADVEKRNTRNVIFGRCMNFLIEKRVINVIEPWVWLC